MINDIKINLTPYFGLSKNLMEFFVIIGYEEETLKETKLLLENQKDIPLTLISNVVSDFSDNLFEPSLIIKKVYPDKPLILQTDKMPEPNSVIFSSCIDSLDGTKKIFDSCYALRFYEKYTHSNKEIYYIPKAFCIYSSYPYFTTFRQICLKLLEYYNNSNDMDKIPIEILIYCFVNYIPSPINNNIILRDLELNIAIPKITGYPYVDFDLAKIINSIPLKDFIKIYILIYLEIELLFFSSDLEKLNMFMFALYILNYPLTDSNYFWHIETISEKDLKLDINSVSSGFKGINTKYSSNLDLSAFKTVDFIIDLESDNIIVNRKETKYSKEIMKLLKYIDIILNGKNKSKSFFLNDSLLLLKYKLKELHLGSENNINKENSTESFFGMNDNINENNRKIQEIFYNFIIETLTVLSKDLELDPSFQYPVNIKPFNNNNLSDEENIFLKKSRDSVKYNTYFDLFIKRFTVSEELKLSLLFIDEFVDFKNKKFDQPTDHIPYFQIIDELFNSRKNEAEIKFFDYQREIINNLRIEKIFLSNQEINNYQLFSLNQNIIKVFIFHKKNKGYYKTLKKKEEFRPESISKASIIRIVENYFLNNFHFSKKKYYLKSCLVFIFSITFPLIPISTAYEFLMHILKMMKEMKIFQRYYFFILLRSINKYYIVNQETGQFKDFTLMDLKILYKLIEDNLNKNSIIQNEEIFIFFKEVFSEQNKIKPKEIDEKNDKSHFIYNAPKKDEKIEINNFDELVTENNNSLFFKRGNERIGCNKKALPYLFQDTFSLYDYYFSEYNFNIEKLEVDEITNICINIIFRLIQIEDNNTILILNSLVLILKKLKNQLNIYNHKKEKKEN